MVFREGDFVEVLRRGKEQYDSWYPGKILSVDGYLYTVSYLFCNQNGNPVVEEVYEENIRPPPPPPVEVERWEAGDMIEVFELHCWKVGKVAKVLSRNRFVIKPFGSIQLKEFQQSDLRIRQAWQRNKWLPREKVGGNRQIKNAGNRSKGFQGSDGMALQQVIHKDAGMKDYGQQEYINTFSPAGILKRKHECNFGSSAVDSGIAGGAQERKNAKVKQYGTLPIRKRAVLEQVAVCSSPVPKPGKECMIRSKMDVKTSNYFVHPYAMPLRVANESSECSVASCSGNGLPNNTIQRSRKSFRDMDGSSFDDAQSFCASESGRKKFPSYPKVQLEADVHRLELHAYKLTMQALYASGPLSWEQESLLTNLRLSLHISNEEHLVNLRNLLSSEVL